MASALGAMVFALAFSGAPATAGALGAEASNLEPVAGNGMWIWYVSRSSGGKPRQIAAKARRYGVGTVFVKSSDGGRRYWGQFSRSFVAQLKLGGMRVCAWQYVYGNHPLREARLGARAVRAGADCLVIDAEAEYEGRYASASRYIRALRSAIGPEYPLGLAGFPYVDYHPGFPYSVFLGPDAAQLNLPQIYWKAIGTTVDRAFAHTFSLNGLYGRPIFPIGQLWQNPRPSAVIRFRQLALAYGAGGTSWWSWQEAKSRGWAALTAPLLPVLSVPATRYPLLRRGSRGDLVVWLQQHLPEVVAAGAVNGVYGPLTERVVRSFQTATGLAATGTVTALTWQSLLRLPAARLRWLRSGAVPASRAKKDVKSSLEPRSAGLPAIRYEIPAKRVQRAR